MENKNPGGFLHRVCQTLFCGQQTHHHLYSGQQKGFFHEPAAARQNYLLNEPREQVSP
jgi:hypothetical protein